MSKFTSRTDLLTSLQTRIAVLVQENRALLPLFIQLIESLDSLNADVDLADIDAVIRLHNQCPTFVSVLFPCSIARS